MHYWQPCLGQNGRSFRFYKFRSMVRGVDRVLARHLELDAQAVGDLPELDNDPRTTPVGRFIRKSRLDELPQFFNMLKRDMSLVGPHPAWCVSIESTASTGRTTARCGRASPACGR
ncbi:sugar transferase [Variovorax sp. LT1P1]|uniref:sugar transferase n=1 Tax=Variovorax sp. LT1P1 TaxID=3443730 RepID=UPI003F458526